MSQVGPQQLQAHKLYEDEWIRLTCNLKADGPKEASMRLMIPSSLVVMNKTGQPIPYLLLGFQVSKSTFLSRSSHGLQSEGL